MTANVLRAGDRSPVLRPCIGVNSATRLWRLHAVMGR